MKLFAFGLIPLSVWAQSPDVTAGPIMTALVNAGGMGIMAAALLWLHYHSQKAAREDAQNSMKAFREELKEERVAYKDAVRHDREAFETRNTVLVSAIDRQTGMVVSRLDNLAVAQERFGGKLDTIRLQTNSVIFEPPRKAPKKGGGVDDPNSGG